MLWNYEDMKSSWSFISVASLKHMINPTRWNWRFWKSDTADSKWGGIHDKETDPHYRLMLAYKDAPDWWYGMVLVVSMIIGLIMLYLSKSTLPWWGFIVSCLLVSTFRMIFMSTSAQLLQELLL
jgi:hypothetical protein